MINEMNHILIVGSWACVSGIQHAGYGYVCGMAACRVDHCTVCNGVHGGQNSLSRPRLDRQSTRLVST